MSSHDALLLPKGDFLRAQACLVTLQLRGLHDREDCAETLVLHDRALVDASVLVERRGGKQSTLAADLDSTVLPLEYADALAPEGQSLGTWLDQIGDSLEVDDQVAGHRPLLLPAEDAGEVLVAAQRPVGVVGVLRRASETLVVVRHELRQERIPGFHRRDAAQAQFLDQPVLQRLVHPLDAALCLRRIRADDVDVELGQGAPELRDAPGPARRALVVHAEDAVLVAVEGHRLAVARKIPAGRREVVERRFALHEAQLHHAPGGVVHVDQQGAARPAALEPGVLAPVDLHQLAEALAPVPRLVRRPRLLTPGNPDAGADEPRPERLPGYSDIVQLEELLAG